MDTGEELHQFQHKGEVRSVYLHRQLLATGSSDRLARVWIIGSTGQELLETYSPLAHFQHEGWVLSVCFAERQMANGGQEELLATGSADHFARLWDLTDKGCTELHRFEHGAEVNIVVLDKTGMMLATGSDDTWARIFSRHLDGFTFNELHRFKHDGPVTSVFLAGRRLITAASDKFARVWDVPEHRQNKPEGRPQSPFQKKGMVVRQFQHLDMVQDVFVALDV